jgi:DNA ligase D-like protein (predicted ligase)
MRLRVGFIEPMECLPVSEIPEGPLWTYEIKLDGYRIMAARSAGQVILYSRRGNDLTSRYRAVAAELDHLADGTVIDGELVALDEQGKPNFNLLQNYRSSESPLMYYAFDVLVHRGREVMTHPLSERRELLASAVQPGQSVGLSQVSNSAAEMLEFIKAHRLEGVVAKRADSVYQPGQRTGLWSKHRVNQRGEFVIGGYVPSHLGVDSIVVGFYRGKDLHYAARVRAGFVPLTRRQVYEAIKGLKTPRCPFVSLPEKDAGRLGQGLTAEKMKECVWVKPERVAEIEFLEWTGADHLRHTSFIGLKDNKNSL